MHGNLKKRFGMHPEAKDRKENTLGENALLYQEVGATLSKEKIVDIMKEIIGKESKKIYLYWNNILIKFFQYENKKANIFKII